MKPLQTRNDKRDKPERFVPQETKGVARCEPKQVESEGETLSTINSIEDKIVHIENVLTDLTNKIRPIVNTDYLSNTIEERASCPVQCFGTPLAQRLQNSEQRLEKVLTYCSALVESVSI